LQAEDRRDREGRPADAGDIWTWTGIDADSKVIVSYLVGDRSGEAALELMDDLRGRLAHRVQLITDGYRAYLEADEGAFGCPSPPSAHCGCRVSWADRRSPAHPSTGNPIAAHARSR
jgi:hypothetical protein